MGNKSDRKGKYITYNITIGCLITVLLFGACTPFYEKIAEIQAHRDLEEYREKLADGFFETVIKQSKQVIQDNQTKKPADVALYALGEVYAHTDYTGQDFVLSQYYFEKLQENFPNSPLTSEARVYISLFEEIAAREKEAIALKEQSKKQQQYQSLRSGNQQKKPVRGNIIINGNFDEAFVKNTQLLEAAGTKKPADVALYNLGLIFAHDSNPKQDYKKSRLYFSQLMKQFPDSEFFEEAEVWLGLFKTIEKIQQIDIDIEQQKKQLSQ